MKTHLCIHFFYSFATQTQWSTLTNESCVFGSRVQTGTLLVSEPKTKWVAIGGNCSWNKPVKHHSLQLCLLWFTGHYQAIYYFFWCDLWYFSIRQHSSQNLSSAHHLLSLFMLHSCCLYPYPDSWMILQKSDLLQFKVISSFFITVYYVVVHKDACILLFH